MQERATCNSDSSKPSKYESILYTHTWSSKNTYSDSDKKRSTACKDPNSKKK
jgi:hypothetical protein